MTYIITKGKHQYTIYAANERKAIRRAEEMGISAPFTVRKGK